MGLDLHIFSVKRHPDKAIDSKLTVKNFINLEQYLTFKNFEIGVKVVGKTNLNSFLEDYE